MPAAPGWVTCAEISVMAGPAWAGDPQPVLTARAAHAAAMQRTYLAAARTRDRSMSTNLHEVDEPVHGLTRRHVVVAQGNGAMRNSRRSRQALRAGGSRPDNVDAQNAARYMAKAGRSREFDVQRHVRAWRVDLKPVRDNRFAFVRRVILGVDDLK